MKILFSFILLSGLSILGAIVVVMFIGWFCKTATETWASYFRSGPKG